MRLKIGLLTDETNGILPVNYQYPLSSAIYRIISSSDQAYAEFLHSHGYQKTGSLKTFKLFTFSDLKTPFKINKDRLIMTSNEANFIACFHMPEALTHFVQGLFLNEHIDIADKISRVRFAVKQVETLPLFPDSGDDLLEVILQPLSPLVVSVVNENDRQDFLYPGDERFATALLSNWKDRYSVVYGKEQADVDFEEAYVAVVNPEKAKSRLITIKSGTRAETKIRGMVGFKIRVIAKARVLNLALDAGVGRYCSQGFGCMGVVG